MHGVLCFLAIFTLAYCADNWTPPPVCLLPKQRGPCSAQIKNFFYNPVSGRCDSFMFSGCGGNENRFRTEESCNRHCVCHIPPEAGPCRSAMEKWFYNPTTGCCEKFTYGGCQGNSNNFQTYEECRSTCVGSAPGMVKPRGSNWGSGSEIHFETNNFYNPQKYGNKFTGSKSLWIHGDRSNVMRGTQQANQIIRFITPDLHKKEHWHFVAKQDTKNNFPQRLKITGLSSNSQTIPVGGSRMVLSGSSSMPGGSAGGQFISSGGSFSESVPVGGSKLVMSGKTSIPMGSARTSGGAFSFGTSGGSLSQSGGNPMGGSKLVLSGSRSVPAGGSGRISSMLGTSGGNGLSGLGGSSLKISGHSAGGMGDDHPSGSSFESAHSGARHPVGMGSGFVGGMTNALSQGQGMMSGQPTGGGFMSRASMQSKSNSAPFPKSQTSLTLPVEDVVGGSAAIGKLMNMMGGRSGGSMGGGGTGQGLIGGGSNRGRENFVSANSNPWHPMAGKK
ncbi:uncharacterized protein LOC133201858 [Saccostrea echinata]|uniref:uncharacterized protein LOC133201858 n=1 Tax=Saccostrea echinata TaxID=191078 RepID=UPI002A7FD42F|nr:uncharacterized protein LOC133201858 [Saccostrea echinata]